MYKRFFSILIYDAFWQLIYQTKIYVIMSFFMTKRMKVKWGEHEFIRLTLKS